MWFIESDQNYDQQLNKFINNFKFFSFIKNFVINQNSVNPDILIFSSFNNIDIKKINAKVKIYIAVNNKNFKMYSSIANYTFSSNKTTKTNFYYPSIYFGLGKTWEYYDKLNQKLTIKMINDIFSTKSKFCCYYDDKSNINIPIKCKNFIKYIETQSEKKVDKITDTDNINQYLFVIIYNKYHLFPMFKNYTIPIYFNDNLDVNELSLYNKKRYITIDSDTYKLNSNQISLNYYYIMISNMINNPDKYVEMLKNPVFIEDKIVVLNKLQIFCENILSIS